jgi:3-oxoacyl-[acyl-carrier protein] reductase
MEEPLTKTGEKVALITGASRGIGAEIARRLARDGVATVINYAGQAQLAESLAKDIEKSGGRAITAQADVSDPVAVKRMFEAARLALGGVDVLVNNAGIMELRATAEMDDAVFDRMIAINLKGTFNTLREAATSLRPGGRIINISSSVVALKLPTYGPYAATKAAVEALTAVLAKEMRGRNITVNAIAPGPTATELFLKDESEALIQSIAKSNPLERLGEPADIAAAVSFLAGPDGGWVNGQMLRVNGGMI